jgi:hypothetical protein
MNADQFVRLCYLVGSVLFVIGSAVALFKR